jgi:hypothetical protein
MPTSTSGNSMKSGIAGSLKKWLLYARLSFPEDLRPLLQQNDFDGCVVVQSDQSELENEFHFNELRISMTL